MFLESQPSQFFFLFCPVCLDMLSGHLGSNVASSENGNLPIIEEKASSPSSHIFIHHQQHQNHSTKPIYIIVTYFLSNNQLLAVVPLITINNSDNADK